MQYLSLIELMRVYGCYLKDRRYSHAFDYNIVNHTIESLVSQCNPFFIEDMSAEEKKTKGLDIRQVMNNVKLNPHIYLQSVYSHWYDVRITLPLPAILEVEWMRNKIELSDALVDLLNQISYMVLIEILKFTGEVADFENVTITNFLTKSKIMVETDDLEKTVKELSDNPLPEVRNVKNRCYDASISYGTNFSTLYSFCVDNMAVKKLFFHLPFLLSMFMMDYQCKNLRNWTSDQRIGIEHSVTDVLNQIETYPTHFTGPCTYGTTVTVTEEDIKLISEAVRIISEKISEINNHIGLISFHNYQSIHGPQKKKGKVLLTGLHIDWKKEMERVEREKQLAEME